MAFIRKFWVNKAADGTIPENAPKISAENLNRIEEGIENSVQKDGGTMTGELILNGDPSLPLHASTKQYVDNNILHFHGSVELINDDKETCNIYLPEGIISSKYSVFIAANIDGKNGNMMRFLPWDTYTTLMYESTSSHLGVNLSSTDSKLSFKATLSGGRVNFDFSLFLIPTSQQVVLSSSAT